MRGAYAIALVLVLAGLAPMAAGFHLSAGANDAVGVTPEESPADPTVPLDRQKVGLELPSTCFQADGNVTGSSGSVTAALESDDFCGRLVYNENPDLDFVQPKPGDWQQDTLDQDLRTFSMGDGTQVSITQFDVVQAQEAGAAYYSDGFSTCFVPGTGPTYKDAHDQGAALGLTEDGQAVGEKEPSDSQNPCDVYYGAQVSYPNAGQLVQQTTGAMDMNGWMTPGKTKFIGFLKANIGSQADVVVDDHVLQAIVSGEEAAGIDITGDNQLSASGAAGADGGLPAEAIPKVCGFFPAEGNKGTLESRCDIEFKWIGPQEDPSSGEPPLSSTDYSDWCAARAYLCGANTPAWYSEFLSSAIGGHLLNQFLVQEQSTTGYDIFHWVAAPTQSACGGDQEPGFLFSPPSGSSAAAPYLGHDLDVYTTPSTAGNVFFQQHADEAANAAADQVAGDPVGTVEDAIELPPEVTGPVNEAEDQAINATYATWKDRVLEPNAVGDTSQTSFSASYVDSTGALAADLVREAAAGSALEDCEILRGNSEQVADPWVPYLDSRTTKDVNTDLLFIGPYNDLTFDKQQDAYNRGDSWQYFHFGEMAMTNDRNDGGGYGFPGTDNLLKDIDQRYPLFWDMWVEVDETTGDVTIDEDGGCQYTGTGLDEHLPAEMKKAGYGKHTGLIQAMYLREPSYQFNFVSTNTFPFIGDRVYVQLSANYIEILRQSLGPDLADGTSDDVDGDVDTSASIVKGLIDQALERLPKVSGYGDGTFTWAPQGVNEGGVLIDDKVEVMSIEHDDSVDLDYSAQCDFPWFGWQNLWSFGPHACGSPETSALVCADDTVVTHYVMEVTDAGPLPNTIGTPGGKDLPAFKPDGETPFEFGVGMHSMFDVDPFDNDRSRNIEEDTDPCTAGDFESGARIECPHKVSGVSNTGATITWDGVIEETEIQERRTVGSIHYVVEATDSTGALVDSAVVTDGSGSATLGIPSGTTVDVTVQAVYNFGTDISAASGFQPASYDRPGPASDPIQVTG